MVGIAWLARLRFLSRIEAVRTDAVTAVLDGKLTHHPVVSAYVTVLDRLARDTRRAMVWLIAEGLAGGGDSLADDPAWQKLLLGEQEVMQALVARMLAAVRGYLPWGNPLVWPWSLARRPAETASRTSRARNQRCRGGQA